MRTFLLLMLCILFICGCVSLGSIKKTNQLYQGMTMTQVRNVLGQPSQTQFVGDKVIWKYSLHQYFVGWIPYYLAFNGETQTLDSWYADEQEYFRNQQMWMSTAQQMQQSKSQSSMYQQSSNNPQYLNPDMECRKYPPGYSIPARGGMITYPDGTVCFPKEMEIRDTSGRIIGTAKER